MDKLKKNNKYQILTHEGFKDFYGINKVESKNYYILTLSNNKTIKATPNHQIYNVKKLSIKISDIKIGLYLTLLIKVINIEKKLNNDVNLFYDINHVDILDNSFLINKEINSHNCGGDAILLSTPRGVGNTFHKLWVKALAGLSKFNTIKLGWEVHPDRDLLWARKLKLLSGLKTFARLYDCNFAASGLTFILQTLILEMAKKHQKLPIRKMINNNLWIFEYPLIDKLYIISCDVARGDGNDYNAFHVIDVNDNYQSVLFKGKMETDLYGELIVKIATLYNNAFVIVLNANVGWSTVQTIINLKYDNLYYHKKDYKYYDPQLLSRSTKKNDKQRDVAGFTTSSKTRPLILEKLKQLIRDLELIINSSRTYNLLETFIWLRNKPQAMSGYHDDLVMSLAIGGWVKDTSYIITRLSKKLIKSRIKSVKSALHLRYKKLTKIKSGFFNSRNNYINRGETFTIGELLVDLYKFLFPKKYG